MIPAIVTPMPRGGLSTARGADHVTAAAGGVTAAVIAATAKQQLLRALFMNS